jgi:hypothetical protein
MEQAFLKRTALLTKNKYAYIIAALVIVWVLLLFLSLHFGMLDKFFYAAEHANVKGIDYFALPKSYLNLLEKRSIFDTWGGTPYGPRATWYLAHPAFSVFVMSWFSWFSPWTSYWLFNIFSILLLVFGAKQLANYAISPVYKTLCYALIICSFTVYWMLYVGNMQAPLVLSLALIFSALFGFLHTQKPEDDVKNRTLLMAGLLISFFTKPLVLIMLPALIFNRLTRMVTLKAIGIYAIVSFLFIVVPFLNPETIGLSRIVETGLNPAFIKENMNIYKNNFVLNEYMKDNAIHWFNLLAQSDFYLNHVEVFSLSVFMNTISGKELPGIIYKFPMLLTIALSFLLLIVKDEKRKIKATLFLVGAISLTFFLSYNTVWEYQYTGALPFVAVIALLFERKNGYRKILAAMLAVSVFLYLPSLYCFIDSDTLTSEKLILIRSTRVLPTFILYLFTIYLVVSEIILSVTNQNEELALSEG